MRRGIAVTLLAVVVTVCGCGWGSERVREAPALSGQAPAPWPGDATPFGAAKARRQISTWTWRRGYVAIEPYADMVSSVSMLSRVTKEFVDNCHKADIEVYVAVTGRPDEMFDTGGHAEASAKQILKQCEEVGADGVDLHYEGFGAEHREQYMDCVVALAKELHRTGRKLNVSVGPLTLSDTGAGHRYDPEMLGEVCDQVRVMCCGLVPERDLPTRPTAMPGRAREIMQEWMTFVPREKLVMGLPAYSYDTDLATGLGREVWRNTPPVAPTEIIKEGGLSDEAFHYYIYPDKDRHLHILRVTDPSSTGTYLAIADELDIPAISFWTADRATPETWQTVRDWLTRDPDVVIEADADFFKDTITVPMRTPLVGREVRYTLDGSEPTADSPLYTKPLILSETTTVKARAFGNGRAAGFTTATLAVVKVWPAPKEQPGDVAPGLSFEYYEGPWEDRPDFDSLRPVADGVAESFGINHRKRDDSFGFRFTGYIKVSTEGVYTFVIRSDDGLRLWIGGKLMIDDYGFHPAREVRASIALAPGLYPIRADYFEWDGDERLTVSWEGPGIEKQDIPPEVLFHKAGGGR